MNIKTKFERIANEIQMTMLNENNINVDLLYENNITHCHFFHYPEQKRVMNEPSQKLVREFMNDVNNTPSKLIKIKITH